MSIPFDEKLERYRRLCDIDPENYENCYEYNLARMRSGKISPLRALDMKLEILNTGNSALPLVEILLSNIDFRLHGMVILTEMNTKESFSRAFNQITREKDIYEKEAMIDILSWFKFNEKFEKEFEKILDLVYDLVIDHQRGVAALIVLIELNPEVMSELVINEFIGPLKKVIESKTENTLGFNATFATNLLEKLS